ncbi:Phage tail assembly chaperone protein [uncultured Caudovirales phage]|uniref:Phage tail assembly chaperone protein n=1 Tax=uncultured Caudovirales phage TaxID=2100421 RepID=A0A6J7WKR4_9CAUD|nr:Phage tail assembly chaperone protein [uncultured Caudovirales phage]
MFVKFDENGHQAVTSNMLPEDQESHKDFYEIPHSIPEGSFVKLLDGKVVQLSETELEAMFEELKLISLKRMAIGKRDQLLQQSEELVKPDVWESYTDAKKKLVSEYRQALKDIEKQVNFPKEVNFPVLSI